MTFGLLSAASHAAPAPECEGSPFRFGKVVRGVVVRHEFRVHNAADQPLRISGAQVTPPLMLSKMRAVIEPERTGLVPVSLDTSLLEGPFTGEVILNFAGLAVPCVLSVEGEIQPAIEILPRPAFFVSTPKGVAKTAVLEIVNHDAEPVEVSIPQPAPDYPIHLEAIEPGRRYRMTLRVPSTATPGRQSGRIELETSHPRYRSVPVGIHVTVRDRIYTFPDQVEFGDVSLSLLKDDNRPVSYGVQTLMIYQTSGRDFQVEATSDIHGLELRLTRGPMKDRYEITATLPGEGISAGALEGTITLKTNDVELPELKIRVIGRIVEAMRK
jgi:hypothetical protein